ncbi:MAG: NAD(P)-binding domain-containing protein, partial [Gramella sp.]|nr:NAD(P)-binding domain-containing protein [Christiangramia sp.]
MIKVVIIGAGNVATHLYRSFSQAEQIEVIQVFNRNKDHLNFVQDQRICTSDLSEIKEADLYLIAIKDEAIAKFALEFKVKSGIIAHTSGSVHLKALEDFENYG